MAAPDDETRYDTHPRGTLVIIAAFGILFLVGWLAMYFFVFAGRGLTH
jgi:hypothetical protein